MMKLAKTCFIILLYIYNNCFAQIRNKPMKKVIDQFYSCAEVQSNFDQQQCLKKIFSKNLVRHTIRIQYWLKSITLKEQAHQCTKSEVKKYPLTTLKDFNYLICIEYRSNKTNRTAILYLSKEQKNLKIKNIQNMNF